MNYSDDAAPVARTDDVLDAYRNDMDEQDRAALWSWVGFTGTFAVVRAITYSIRAGVGPFRNIKTGGTHLHHYLWGIAMVSAVGAVGVHGDDERRHRPGIALTYGAGLALIVDEFALLLDLKDVYWERQGRISVDAGVGVIAASGTVFASLPLLRRLGGRRHRPARLMTA